MQQSRAWLDAQGKVLESCGSPMPIYSITKTFIAAAICAMGIKLVTPVAHWIEPAVLPWGDKIQVKHLLQHSSGLRDYGNLPEYILAVENRQSAWSDEEFSRHTLQQSLLFEPGTKFSYSNPGYWVLSQIAQRESQLDFNGVLKKYIFQPLGLTQTRAAHGIFSPVLSDYPAEWVWHGLVLSTALEVASFIASDLVLPLLQQQIRVPGTFSHWAEPHYGFGLMVEPNVRYGHEGGGPGFSAACFRFLPSGLTGSVLLQSTEGEAFNLLLEEKKRKWVKY